MKATPLIVDAGPLVASLNRRDRHHDWVVAQLKREAGVLVTCEAVLTEATFLVGRDGGDPPRSRTSSLRGRLCSSPRWMSTLRISQR